MLKTTKKKIFRGKVFSIVFSLIAAIALWLYIAYAQNDDIVVTVSGIQIELSGVESVEDKGLIISDMNVDTLTVRFSGKRNRVSKLNNENTTATVSLNEIVNSGAPGVYQLSYTINYPSGISESTAPVSSASSNYITLTVEKYAEKKVPVKGTYDGTIQEGFQAEPIQFNPETITISGPSSVVSEISYVWVVLERDNLNKTVEDDVPFILMDEDDKEIKSDLLTYSSDTVMVTLPIVMVKEVTLVANLIAAPGASEENTIVKFEPEKIQISGAAEILADLNQIVVGTIDLSKFASTATLKFPIIIPNDTENITGATEVVVNVEIVGLETKQLSSSNIQTANVTAGYSATIITQSLDVTVRAAPSVIDEIEMSHIRIVADLSELGNTTGTFSVPAKVHVDGGFTDAGAVGEYTVTVSVTEG